MISRIKSWWKLTEPEQSKPPLKVGDDVIYLEKKWTVTFVAMPADVMHRRFAILERINEMDQHELVEVEGISWQLIRPNK